MVYIVVRASGVKYTSRDNRGKEFVSRETKATFHVKHTADSRYPAAPPRCFYHEIVQIAGRDPRDPRRLGQRRGTDSIELLPRLGCQTLELEIRKLSRQHERSELGEPAGSLALAREITVVFELDLRARQDGVVARHRHARRLQQRPQ